MTLTRQQVMLASGHQQTLTFRNFCNLGRQLMELEFLQTRMQRLEGVRLEVDSRRRTVADLARKIDRQRAKLPQTRSKGEFEMEQTIKKMQHKENKLSGKSSTTAP